jgi:alpha-D-xyloside xylohydrolase
MNFMKRAGFVLTCATMLANLCAAQKTRSVKGEREKTRVID